MATWIFYVFFFPTCFTYKEQLKGEFLALFASSISDMQLEFNMDTTKSILFESKLLFQTI